jgi:hypothetical protein
VKVLRILAGVLLALAIGAGLAYSQRTDPIGPVAGRALSGAEAAYPPDWGFSDAHMTIAVEARPEDPHSVTTLCFLHEGALYVPAMNGSEKEWTQMVVADGRVRLKIGDRVYPALAERVPDADFAAFLPSAAGKYSSLAEADEPPPDVWLFRIGPREG